MTHAYSALEERASAGEELDHVLQARRDGVDGIADEEKGTTGLDALVCWGLVSVGSRTAWARLTGELFEMEEV